MKTLTTKEAVQLYLDSIENYQTQRTQRYSLHQLLEFIGTIRTVETITRVDLQHYANHLRTKYDNAHTITRHMKSTKRFFNWLVEMKLLDKNENPGDILKPVKPKVERNRDKAMSDEDLEKVLELLRYNPMQYALIRFIADTGCRAGGARGLIMKNLHLTEGRAIITEKGNKTRTVYFGKGTQEALRVWLSIRHYPEYDWVFCHAGGQYTTTAVSQILRRACRRVGVKPRGVHSLRHRKGHQLADSGIALTVAAGLLGNTPEVTAEHYFPHDDVRVQKAAHQLFLDAEEVQEPPDPALPDPQQEEKDDKQEPTIIYKIPRIKRS